MLFWTFFSLKTAENNFGINSFWSLAQWIGEHINCFFLHIYVYSHNWNIVSSEVNAISMPLHSSLVRKCGKLWRMRNKFQEEATIKSNYLVIFNVCSYSKTRHLPQTIQNQICSSLEFSEYVEPTLQQQQALSFCYLFGATYFVHD